MSLKYKLLDTKWHLWALLFIWTPFLSILAWMRSRGVWSVQFASNIFQSLSSHAVELSLLLPLGNLPTLARESGFRRVDCFACCLQRREGAPAREVPPRTFEGGRITGGQEEQEWLALMTSGRGAGQEAGEEVIRDRDKNNRKLLTNVSNVFCLCMTTMKVPMFQFLKIAT